jgi:hypothetical protein
MHVTQPSLLLHRLTNADAIGLLTFGLGVLIAVVAGRTLTAVGVAWMLAFVGLALSSETSSRTVRYGASLFVSLGLVAGIAAIANPQFLG